MKKYLISSIRKANLVKVCDFYDKWNFEKVKNLDFNKSTYTNFKLSAIDSIYIFGTKLNKEDDFFITSADIYISKEGIFYYNYLNDDFERFENNSQIYITRKIHFEEKYIYFLKVYAKEIFNIDVLGVNFESTLIQLKRFGIYYGFKSGLKEKIPNSVIPMVSDLMDLDILGDFLKFYFTNKNIIIKKESSCRGNDANILDTNFKGFKNNIKSTFLPLIEKNIKDIIIMELLDIKKEEFRVLWCKNKNRKAEIIGIYKRVKLDGQLILEPSKGDNLQLLNNNDLSIDLENDIKKICQNFEENFGGLDVIFGNNGEYYFLENNPFTGYLSTDLEYDLLKIWLDKISENYLL